MTISAADFFRVAPRPPWDGPDTKLEEVFDTPRLQSLIEAPKAGPPDLDVALALIDLVRDDLHLSGTEGGQTPLTWTSCFA